MDSRAPKKNFGKFFLAPGLESIRGGELGFSGERILGDIGGIINLRVQSQKEGVCPVGQWGGQTGEGGTFG